MASGSHSGNKEPFKTQLGEVNKGIYVKSAVCNGIIKEAQHKSACEGGKNERVSDSFIRKKTRVYLKWHEINSREII